MILAPLFALGVAGALAFWRNHAIEQYVFKGLRPRLDHENVGGPEALALVLDNDSAVPIRIRGVRIYATLEDNPPDPWQNTTWLTLKYSEAYGVVDSHFGPGTAKDGTIILVKKPAALPNMKRLWLGAGFNDAPSHAAVVLPPFHHAKWANSEGAPVHFLLKRNVTAIDVWFEYPSVLGHAILCRHSLDTKAIAFVNKMIDKDRERFARTQ